MKIVTGKNEVYLKVICIGIESMCTTINCKLDRIMTKIDEIESREDRKIQDDDICDIREQIDRIASGDLVLVEKNVECAKDVIENSIGF